MSDRSHVPPKDLDDWLDVEESWPYWLASLVGLALLWVYVVEPTIRWITQNWVPIVFAILAVLTVTGVILVRRKQAEKDFATHQRSKGLVLFTDYVGKQRWGTPEEADRASRVARLASVVEDFQPSRRYGNEFGYHTELQGWIKSHFRDAKVELATGASRPDIVVGDVAIEVKGPTDNQALNTLTTKCLKYGQHYRHLLIVLFEPRFSQRNFNEICLGLERHFPSVKVIVKE